MKRTVLKYGVTSGLVASALMAATVPVADRIGFDNSAWVGYAGIVLSFLLVFFGVRAYREEHGGQITFARAFGVGIGITLISCVFYVVTWEIVYFNFMHDFMDKYGAHVIEKARASGASAAVLQAKMDELSKTKAMYENPVTNAAMTFMEPFPVGLVVTLISAGVLRRRRSALMSGEQAVA